MTLRLKLLILVASVTLFAATGVTAVALWRDVGQSQERLACEGQAVAASLAGRAARWMTPDGALPEAEVALAPVLTSTLAAAPLARAWVVDRDGRVAACADRSGRGCPAGRPSALRAAETPIAAIGRLVRGVPLEASAPILSGGELSGAVRVSYPTEGVFAKARGLAASAAAMAGAFIAAGLAFGTVLVRHVTKPITELARAAEALPEGERIEVRVSSDPELNELVAAFNRMSARLRQSRTEMEELIASLNQRVALATEEGLRAERLATLGAIAAGFAHEMGNSLNVITGFNAVVLRELPADNPHRSDLEVIRRESARAAALLERFLFFARARSARPAPQSIEPVVRESVEVVGPAAAGASVKLEVSIDRDLPLVHVDADLLRQAFVNLCVNAVQAMAPGGGRLAVRAIRRDSEIAVEFEDTGPGVAADLRERIFEPFFTTKPAGTGLGLAIVRQAAEANSGSVELDGSPGGGALFRVRLPAAKGAA
ncbi:MAG: sensor histidine kinase [Myxococcales bacterium]